MPPAERTPPPKLHKFYQRSIPIKCQSNLRDAYQPHLYKEANEAKADNLLQTVVGNDEKQMQGYRDRLQIREVLESRLAREIILEPRR
jgi:hypothetical protein